MPDSRPLNANRFTGFAATYDSARPAAPPYVVEQLTAYLGHTPDTVVDLGSGTGLSTRVWLNRCRRAIGVEPSEDMRAVAQSHPAAGLSFRPGYGNDTGLPDGCADIVVCSQSFHWMEPVSTLREVGRLLRPGGVFATVDCDWPPVTDWRAEQAYMNLYAKVKRLETELPDVRESFVRYPKEKHLKNIQACGLFACCREIVFQNTESATAERFVNLILSQGSLQTIRRLHPQLLEEDVERFSREAAALLPVGEFPLTFCYRMRVGVRRPDKTTSDSPQGGDD